MNIDEIPTPETDAVRDRLIVGGYEPHECFREWQNSHRDLERRFSVARGALMKARERIKYTDPKILGMEEIDQALTLTAPTP